MRKDQVPIEIYIPHLFQQDAGIASMIQPWRVEPGELQEVIIRAIREMGIYTVDVGVRDLIKRTALTQLRFSPEIRKMLQKAEEIERGRTRSRVVGD